MQLILSQLINNCYLRKNSQYKNQWFNATFINKKANARQNFSLSDLNQSGQVSVYDSNFPCNVDNQNLFK